MEPIFKIGDRVIEEGWGGVVKHGTVRDFRSSTMHTIQVTHFHYTILWDGKKEVSVGHLEKYLKPEPRKEVNP